MRQHPKTRPHTQVSVWVSVSESVVQSSGTGLGRCLRCRVLQKLSDRVIYSGLSTWENQKFQRRRKFTDLSHGISYKISTHTLRSDWVQSGRKWTVVAGMASLILLASFTFSSSSLRRGNFSLLKTRNNHKSPKLNMVRRRQDFEQTDTHTNKQIHSTKICEFRVLCYSCDKIVI